MTAKVVIFTDLDGTLLDHENYSFAAAEPALDFIREHEIPLIFTTSKTAIEVESLCHLSNFYHPFIAENGGILSTPENYFSKNKTTKKYIKTVVGKSRSDINHALNSLNKTYNYKSFKQMNTEELIGYTGLNKRQAQYANQRDSTEPLLWLDEKETIPEFAKLLEEFDLRLVKGGRFLHVMGKHDKATTMSLLASRFTDHWNTNITTIALGDSPNDLDMLSNADYAVIIPNPYAPKLSIAKHANLLYAEQTSPQGWNDSVFKLLKELI